MATSDHQLYRVSPLKTPFGLLIPLLQSQPHVTTITHNYFSHYATFTQLTILHVRNYNHLFYLSYSLPNTLDIFTLPVSVSYRDLTRRRTT
jgi:hypothetical protein